MKRKQFVKLIGAASILSVTDPTAIVETFVPYKDLVLPFFDGPRNVTFLKPKQTLLRQANAQYGYYNGNNYYAQHHVQQWYAYQQAVAAWRQQMLFWQQQNAWLQQMHIQQMQQMMQNYQSYGQISSPSVWSSIQSIYGVARRNSQGDVLFGLNSNQQPIAVQNTLPATDGILKTLSQRYSTSLVERIAGPQSNEGQVDIQLPDASLLKGTAYATNGNSTGGGGFVAISNFDRIRADNGHEGRLVKYTGPTGIEFGVV